MGIQLQRKKPRNLLLTVLYRTGRLLPISKKQKFKLYLDLEWIFDRLAMEASYAYYPGDIHPARNHTRQCILEGIASTDSVLDLGCSTGFISNYISEKAKKVVGVDHNATAISTAKERWKRDNLSFEVGDAGEYLKRTQTPFDVLILSHILEHIDDPKAFLNHFKNHFKRIYIEVPDFDRYHLNHYRKDLGLDLVYSDIDHVVEFDRWELKALIADCGLHIEQADYIFGVQRIWCLNPDRK